MKKITLRTALVVLSIAVLSSANAAELHLYAGAGLKDPVEKIVKQFEQQTGNNVTIEYGGSGQLLSRYQTTQIGDLYLPGSADYVEKLANTGSVTESAPIVRHIPVMVIRKDKTEGIDSFKTLAESHLRLGIGDSKAMALGKGAEKMIELSGYNQALTDKIVVHAATMNQLMLYLLNGDIDAAVIGRAGAWKIRDKIVILPTPPGTPEEIVTLALLRTSKHPVEAKALFDLFKSEQGMTFFTEEGFLPLGK